MIGSLYGRSLVALLSVLIIAGIPTAVAHACTIFVLVDRDHALFFNNEDYSNPNTRIWFVPAASGRYGAVYVGFDNGWAQGGLNTKGLAFDWVAGFEESWRPAPGMHVVRGNPSQRMLERCGTVDCAIRFYEAYQEPSFAYAKTLIADASGASIIVGAKKGRIQIERSSESRGFGYGGRILSAALAAPPKPSVDNGATILRACLQNGPNATKYSNVFDLRSGDIAVYTTPGRGTPVTLNVHAELRKGGHYYDIPALREQLTEPPRALPPNIRFAADDLEQITDREPHVTNRIRRLIVDAAAGKMHASDYTNELWAQLAPERSAIRVDLNRFGALRSMTLVARVEDRNQRTYRYRLEFENGAMLQLVTMDKHQRVASMKTEAAELRNR